MMAIKQPDNAHNTDLSQETMMRQRLRKADLALALATIGVWGTIVLTIYQLSDRLPVVSGLWIGSLLLGLLGLILCYLWHPTKAEIYAALRDSCGLLLLNIVFAALDAHWIDVFLFAGLLLVTGLFTLWQRRSLRQPMAL
jgi:hypothetical protein